MDFGLKGKVALVTGASKGIGLATAMVLAGEGCRVAICARTRETLEAAATRIREKTGAETLVVPADLGQPDAAPGVVKAVEDKWGRVDVLVTNAGGSPGGQFETFSEEDWIKAYRLNCLSALSLVKAAVAGMKARRWGRVINLTSVSVKQPIPALILSNGVRPGLVGASKTLSQDYGPFNITVNNIATGYTDTDRVAETLQARAAKAGKTVEQLKSEMNAAVPVGRMNRPEEIGFLVAFLASDKAETITGTTIPVDGGVCGGLL